MSMWIKGLASSSAATMHSISVSQAFCKDFVLLAMRPSMLSTACKKAQLRRMPIAHEKIQATLLSSSLHVIIQSLTSAWAFNVFTYSASFLLRISLILPMTLSLRDSNSLQVA